MFTVQYCTVDSIAQHNTIQYINRLNSPFSLFMIVFGFQQWHLVSHIVLTLLFVVMPPCTSRESEQNQLLRQSTQFIERYNLISLAKLKLDLAHSLISSARHDVDSTNASSNWQQLATEIAHCMADVDNVLWDCQRQRNALVESLAGWLSSNMDQSGNARDRSRSPLR